MLINVENTNVANLKKCTSGIISLKEFHSMFGKWKTHRTGFQFVPFYSKAHYMMKKRESKGYLSQDRTEHWFRLPLDGLSISLNNPQEDLIGYAVYGESGSTNTNCPLRKKKSLKHKNFLVFSYFWLVHN